jgi:hypothetical protein
MEQVIDPLKPMIGLLAWQVRRGHGSFLTIEFGMPHLSVTEPIIASPDASERVRRHLKRRRVFVSGDWHFWVQYGNWKLVTADGFLDNNHPPGSALDECLGDLEGQKLLSVDVESASNCWTLAFDLGALLKIWPTAEIPDDLWSLYIWGGDIISCHNDGKLDIEKRNAAANA